MINKKIYIALLIFFQSSLFLPTFLFSQSYDIKFTRLGTNEGLSQNSINCIHQDKIGFMWFGTQDGLNKYDGFEFKIYRHHAGNKNSLSNNYVWSIYEDKDGIFWIGTFGGGLNRFDPATETFTNYIENPGNEASISDDKVFSITEYPEGILWVATDRGFNKFDKKANRFTRFLNKSSSTNSKKLNHINHLAAFENGEVWLIENQTLTCFNTVSEAVTYYSTPPLNPDIKLGGVYKLSKEGKDLLVSCEAGLLKIDINSRIETLIFNARESSFESLKSGSVFFSARHDAKNDLYWINTSQGLILFDKKKNFFYLFRNDGNDSKSLSHNNVLSTYVSSSGIVWVGTRNGLNRIDRLRNNFTLIQCNRNSENTLSQRNVEAIIKDNRGNVWIGTPDGLNVYNPQTKRITIIKNSLQRTGTANLNYILSLYNDSKGTIWAGTRGGGLVNITLPSDDNYEGVQIKNFIQKKENPGPRTIHYIFEDKNKIIWLGTGGEGLAKYDPKNETFKFFPPNLEGTGPSHPYIFCILEDSKNNFWLGTASGGLNLFDKQTERFSYIKNGKDDPESLSNDMVLSILETRGNNLWIGTAGGLNKLNIPLEENLFSKSVKDTNYISFKVYGMNQGLPNEIIYGILEDNKGLLWFSTNKGLVKFAPGSESPVLKIYNVFDGIQANEFNQNGYYKSNNGEMFFGGIDGMNIFYPDSIATNTFVPPVVLTDFKLFNKQVPLPVNTNDSDVFSLPELIQYCKEIELPYDKNMISFKYSALNFTDPQKNLYKYKMEGFDNEWINAGDKREVTYTNLDPGKYIFRVKGSNNDGVWNEKGAQIQLNILAPPWKTWYAYTIYTGLFFTGIFLFVRYKINSARKEMLQQKKIEFAKLEEREAFRKKSSADFHDEAGNKITKISLFTELAKRESEKNDVVKNYLQKIDENTKELSSGMRDFIWALDPSRDSLTDTLNRIEDFGNSIFNYNNTNFSITGMNDEMNNVSLSMDSRRAIILIFKEAINNIAKHAETTNVELNVKLAGEDLRITLSDDGCGFITKGEVKGFGLNNMKERAAKINSKLEITSSPGIGTKVSFISNITRLGN